MRKRTVVKIDKKEYTVKELTVREILEVFSFDKFDDDGSISAEEKNKAAKDKNKGFADLSSLLGLSGYLRKMLEIAVEGLEVKDLVDMAPSEINEIYEAFKKVNNHFFEIAQSVKLGDQLKKAGTELIENFASLAVSLSRQAMQEYSTTVMGSMSPQSMPTKKSGLEINRT